MKKVIYEGQVYCLNNINWVDSSYIVVNQSLQRELNQIYIESSDFSIYSTQDYLREGDRCKEASDIYHAIFFYEQAIKSLQSDDIRTIRSILPRVTACYRKNNESAKVISLFSNIRKKYGTAFLTRNLLISVAAAYCDVNQYQNALKCCVKAQKMGDRSEALQNVLERIKRETNEGGQ